MPSTLAVPPAIPPAIPADRHGDALKTLLATLLHRAFSDPDRLSELFTEDYEQTTDGTVSDRARFEAHIRHVAALVREIRFTVLDALVQDGVLADRHRVDLLFHDGRETALEVYLFGQLRDGRLARVHEVTRVLIGDSADRAIATARP